MAVFTDAKFVTATTTAASPTTKVAPMFTHSGWTPYPLSSDSKFVYKPKADNVRPVFPKSGPFDVTGSALKATTEWGDKLQKKYPDGEYELVDDYLAEMSNRFMEGKPVPMPTNKYAIEAIEGFLIMIQGFKDHGVQF